jgi:hypothetical protein
MVRVIDLCPEGDPRHVQRVGRLSRTKMVGEKEPRAESRGQRAEGRGQRAEIRDTTYESRRQKAEGREERAEGREQS